MKKTLLVILFVVISCIIVACGSPVTEPETYTITLRGNGGTPIYQSVEVEYGEPMPTLNVIPTRYGYSLRCYATTITCPMAFGDTINIYYWEDGSPARDTYDLQSDLTLYACWDLNY